MNLIGRRSQGLRSLKVLMIALFHTLGALPVPYAAHLFCKGALPDLLGLTPERRCHETWATPPLCLPCLPTGRGQAEDRQTTGRRQADDRQAMTYFSHITANGPLSPSPLPLWWLRPVADRGASSTAVLGLFSPPCGGSQLRASALKTNSYRARGRGERLRALCNEGRCAVSADGSAELAEVMRAAGLGRPRKDTYAGSVSSQATRRVRKSPFSR